MRWVVLGLVVAMAACGGVEGFEEEDNSEIGGTLARANTNVVRIQVRGTGSSVVRTCTGALISASTVLTAASCVWDQHPASLFISQDPDFTDRTSYEELRATRVAVHPTFGLNRFNRSITFNGDAGAAPVYPRFAGIDLAVIKLSRSVSATSFGLAGDLPATGESFTLYGYASSLRRSGSVKELGIYDWPGTDARTIHNKSFVRTTSNTPSCTGGDGGGPLVRYQSGSERIVGVLSFDSPTCGNGVPFYALIGSERTWISAERDR